MSTPERWESKPPRGYTWPPFEKGNTVSTRHGVWSNRKVDPIAGELAAGLLADRGDLIEHPETVWAWARAEARCLLLADHFSEGLFDGEGNERPGLRLIGQFERLAADLRARLGLDPRSQAELARDRAEVARSVVDLEAVRARGRAALQPHDRPAGGPGADGDHQGGQGVANRAREPQEGRE